MKFDIPHSYYRRETPKKKPSNDRKGCEWKPPDLRLLNDIRIIPSPLYFSIFKESTENKAKRFAKPATANSTPPVEESRKIKARRVTLTL